MDFSAIGSIDNYTKTLNMQAQWNLKKKSGDVTKHTSSLDEWLKSSTQSAEEESGSNNDEKLSSILQKAYTGKKLSEDELNYLQTKDPLSYQKIRSIQQEQKSYEQELKKCKTKEDVQRLKMSRIASSLSTVKTIENNPHITQEKKLQLINLEKMRCDKLERTTHAYIKSGEYEQLPSEAEQTKAHQEMEKAEQHIEVEQSKEPAQMEQAKKVATKKQDDKPDTIVEPESPEMRKVRRAKAKAAYASMQKSVDMELGAALDIQA